MVICTVVVKWFTKSWVATLVHSGERVRGRAHMVVLWVLNTNAISAYHLEQCEFELIPTMRGLLNTKLCDKVCQCQWQMGGFLGVLRIPPSIKLTDTI